jgi:hypothetical protein
VLQLQLFGLFSFLMFCGAGHAGVVVAARVAVVRAGAADAMPMCADKQSNR